MEVGLNGGTGSAVFLTHKRLGESYERLKPARGMTCCVCGTLHEKLQIKATHNLLRRSTKYFHVSFQIFKVILGGDFLAPGVFHHLP
jgi:hypothetical protein